MEKGGGSRLMQMQARFQQKQMQEREMKIANLYETQQARALDRVRQSPSNGVRQSPSNASNGVSGISNGSIRSNGSMNSPPQAVAHQPGKVRQMFEERRTKAGIDKSYPLQPIHNTERTRKALPAGYPKVTGTSHSTSRVTENKTTTKTLATRQTSISQQNIRKTTKVHKTDNFVNGSGDLNHNHKPDLNTVKQELPQSNGEPHSIEEEKNENYLLEDETFPETLAPVASPRSPEPAPAPRQEVKAPPRRSPELRNKNNATKAKPQLPPSPRRANAANTASASTRAKGAMQKGATPTPSTIRQPILQSRSHGSAKSRTSEASAAAAGPECSVCGRHFASDRIAKHEEICKKAHAKKRKPFDVLKHRLAGTEAEPFIGKLRKSTTNPSSTKVKALNSTWRQKHAEFIQAIRAAKQVQAHLASGGKLSDLPPPPPSENRDYVSCPHCGRRFNQAAADRHIPKCKDYQFNKPKPAAKRR